MSALSAKRTFQQLGHAPFQAILSFRLVQKSKVRSGRKGELARENEIVKQTGHRYGFLDVHHRNDVRAFGRIEPWNTGRKGEFRDEPDHNSGIRLGWRVTSRSSAAAPDHPWVKDHPEWFKWRPDGTVQYAENPPKKDQESVPS